MTWWSIWFEFAWRVLTHSGSRSKPRMRSKSAYVSPRLSPPCSAERVDSSQSLHRRLILIPAMTPANESLTGSSTRSSTTVASFSARRFSRVDAATATDKRWRNSLADLPEYVIKGPGELESVRETLQACNFALGQTTMLFGVDESATRRIPCVVCDRDGRLVPGEAPIYIVEALDPVQAHGSDTGRAASPSLGTALITRRVDSLWAALLCI